jgi:hypothetical protein
LAILSLTIPHVASAPIIGRRFIFNRRAIAISGSLVRLAIAPATTHPPNSI